MKRRRGVESVIGWIRGACPEHTRPNCEFRGELNLATLFDITKSRLMTNLMLKI